MKRKEHAVRGKTKISRTQKNRTQFYALDVDNLDPNFDYSFRRKSEVVEGLVPYGYEPVSAANYNGETLKGRSGAKQISYQDVILCKRTKETTKFFKDMEDEKYNSQISLVKMAGKNAREQLRTVDPGSSVVNKSKGLERLKQRPGPTEEA